MALSMTPQQQQHYKQLRRQHFKTVGATSSGNFAAATVRHVILKSGSVSKKKKEEYIDERFINYSPHGT